jgi:hypothetical protein
VAPLEDRAAGVGAPDGRAGDAPTVGTSRRENHADRLFHERVRRLHQCGPRPVGELLAEIVARYPRIGPFVAERLAVLAGLDPAWVRWTGSADWLDERDLIRLVGGRS